MRVLIALACLFVAALAADNLDLNDKNWVAYKKRAHLTFDSQEEELARLKYFLQYQNVVGELNKKKGKGETRLFPRPIEKLINGLQGRYPRSLDLPKEDTKAAGLAADTLDLNDKNWVAYKKRAHLTFDSPEEELARLKYFLQYQNVVGELNKKKGKGETRLFPRPIEKLINGLQGRYPRSLDLPKQETKAVGLAAGNLDLNDKNWVAYKKWGHLKFDSPEEELARLKYFLEYQNVVGELNKKKGKGETRLFPKPIERLINGLHGRYPRSLELPTETRGLSHFMDQMHGLYLDLHGRKTRSLNNHINSNTTLPASVDWREKNAVSPVQDQGACGSGWAFAAAGALEAQVAIKTGKLVPLSAQSLIDCSKVEKPCEGGSPVWATAKPVQTLAAYPYVGLAGTCKANETAAKSTEFVPIESGNEKDLQDAVATVGPVTVDIDATDPLLQTYRKGVYAPKNCSSTKLSHVALVVGYGQEDGQDYWLIKNTWGPEWGDKGYFKLIRNGKNTCGIASHAGYLLA